MLQCLIFYPQFRAIKVKWHLVIHNKLLSTILEFVLLRWLLESLQVTWGWRLLAREVNQLKAPTLPSPDPPTSGEEKGAGDGTSTSVLWFNQLCLCNGASIKIQKDKVLLRERDLYWWYPHARDTPVLMGTEALVLRTLPDLTLCTFHLAVHLYPL